jgi:anti-sigma regulatory factor (Ser/Thr protein kinase)
MTDPEFDTLIATFKAKDAFEAFVADHGGIDGALGMNAYCNAFAVEVHDEYADDLQRWTVALATAREYVDQGVTGY